MNRSTWVADNVNGKVGAPELTELAADALFRPYRRGFVFFVQFENIARAEFDTDAAPLAPLPIDDEFLQFFLFFLAHSVILSTASFSGEKVSLQG